MFALGPILGTTETNGHNGHANGHVSENGHNIELQLEELKRAELERSWLNQPRKRPGFFKGLRLASAVVLAIVVSSLLFNYFQNVTSYNGFINGRVYTIRTPIEGTLHLDTPVTVGTAITSGQTIGTVENPRAYDLYLRQLDMQAQLQTAESQLATVENQIAQRSGLLNRFGDQSGFQQKVRVQYETSQSDAMNHELEAARVRAVQAKADAERFQRLAEKGYAARMAAENYQTQAEEAQAAYNQKIAKSQEMKSKLIAAQAGVQVDGSQNASYPAMRRDQLDSEIFQLRMQASELRVQARVLAEKLAETQKEYALVNTALVSSPATGVIWSVDSQAGETVSENKQLITVLDCKDLWVDTYVDDDAVKNIDTKAPVTLKVSAPGKKVTLKGDITAIRSGTGRFSVGQSAIMPPDIKSKSQSLIRIRLEKPVSFPKAQSCGVGSSVEAIFKRK